MDGQWCPLIRKDCVKHKCAWYINVQGRDPQTGQETNNWGCSIAYLPLLQIEMANQSRQTTASVDNLRTEQDNQVRAQCHLMSEIINSQGIEPTTVTEILPE